MSNIPLSASRIKTLQTCSWLYKTTYIDKLPNGHNEGSARGHTAHLVFECLGNPRHRKHFNKIIAAQDVTASPAIVRLILKHAKILDIDDFDNVDLMYRMILEGLNYDFFGDELGKPTESISEKDFDIDVNDGVNNYRIRGFIDKLFLFKKKQLAIIRDFKSSKQVFQGEELSDNMQNLMYCLAVKHLYPEYLKRKMEFLFLKFPLNGEGLVEMDEVDSDELDGFEMFLTQVQKTINNFDEKTALSNLAYDKGYSEKGFAGRVVCGRADFKGELKKDGTPKWSCQARWPMDYFVLLDENGKIITSSHKKEELEGKIKEGMTIEARHYSGCKAFEKKKSVDNSGCWL